MKDCEGLFLTAVPRGGQFTQGYVPTCQHDLCLCRQVQQRVRCKELYDITLIGVYEKIRSCNCQEMSITIFNGDASAFLLTFQNGFNGVEN